MFAWRGVPRLSACLIDIVTHRFPTCMEKSNLEPISNYKLCVYISTWSIRLYAAAACTAFYLNPRTYYTARDDAL